MYPQLIETVVESMPEKYSYNTRDASRLLYAIGLQESEFQHRKQIKGPAKGFFQFEPIACLEVINRDKPLLEQHKLPTNHRDLYNVLQWSEVGMILSARILLYYGSPYRLPKKHETEHAWQNYLKAWRPGKPRLGDWWGNWSKSCQEFK